MKCKVCHLPAKKIFSSQILYKYNIEYFQCSSCGFIQTEDPYWMEEAYSDAIADLDVGLVGRNVELSELATPLIYKHFDSSAKFEYVIIMTAFVNFTQS